jgi:hypothetical protein
MISDIWQFGSRLDIIIVNESFSAPVSKAKKSTSQVYRNPIANVRKKESTFTKYAFDID